MSVDDRYDAPPVLRPIFPDWPGEVRSVRPVSPVEVGHDTGIVDLDELRQIVREEVRAALQESSDAATGAMTQQVAQLAETLAQILSNDRNVVVASLEELRQDPSRAAMQSTLEQIERRLARLEEPDLD